MSDEIKIEKGIPMREVGRKNKWLNVAKKMDVGDSFTVADFKQANSVQACFNSGGFKASMRAQPDGTYRVWKVKHGA